MRVQPPTREFLDYLYQNKDVRDRIKAGRDKTCLYSGVWVGPVWKDLQNYQRLHPGSIEILPDALKKIPAPPGNQGTLFDHVQSFKDRVPSGDEDCIWKALSGIFASNAEGNVYFSVGFGVTADKVFSSREISVLTRNPKISATSRDLLEYYARCIRAKRYDIGTGFLPDS
jgi:hypothetical protein